jgi:hypothetical protein
MVDPDNRIPNHNFCFMKPPEQTPAEAFPRYLGGKVKSAQLAEQVSNIAQKLRTFGDKLYLERRSTGLLLANHQAYPCTVYHSLSEAEIVDLEAPYVPHPVEALCHCHRVSRRRLLRPATKG